MGVEKVYFDAIIEYPFVSLEDILDIIILYKFKGYSERDFSIRILGSNFCLVNKLGQCNLTYGLWDRALGLSESVKVKVVNNFDGKAPLSFEIHNSKTGDVYKTPDKYLWIDDSYPNYSKRLNENIKFYTNYESTSRYVETSSQVGDYTKYLLYFSVLLVLCFVIYKMIKSRSGND